jgi:hypothetical protein
MNLWKKLKDRLGGQCLRNKPGGMAWVCAREKGGVETLYGQVVKTISADERGQWLMEPKLVFVTTCPVRFVSTGNHYPAGTTIYLERLHDDSLEPIREVGDGERDESQAWLPPVPTKKLEEVT